MTSKLNAKLILPDGTEKPSLIVYYPPTLTGEEVEDIGRKILAVFSGTLCSDVEDEEGRGTTTEDMLDAGLLDADSVTAPLTPEPVGYVDPQRLRNLQQGKELSITLVAASEADLREGGDVPVYVEETGNLTRVIPKAMDEAGYRALATALTNAPDPTDYATELWNVKQKGVVIEDGTSAEEPTAVSFSIEAFHHQADNRHEEPRNMTIQDMLDCGMLGPGDFCSPEELWGEREYDSWFPIPASSASADAADARRYRALFTIHEFRRDPLWPVAEWFAGWQANKEQVDAALDAALGVAPSPAALPTDRLEQVIDTYLEDYEMVGEAPDGRDACYQPTDGERALIKDAILGLLANEEWDAEWGKLIEQRALGVLSADDSKGGWAAHVIGRELLRELADALAARCGTNAEEWPLIEQARRLLDGVDSVDGGHDA
jgi:hypothetical protein